MSEEVKAKRLRTAKRKITDVPIREFDHGLVEFANTAPVPYIVLHRDLTVFYLNVPFCRLFQVNYADSVGLSLYGIANGVWDTPAVRRLFKELTPTKSEVMNYLVEIDGLPVGKKIFSINARLAGEGKGANARILIALEDVSEREYRMIEVAARKNLNESRIVTWHKSELTNRDVLNVTSIGIVQCDPLTGRFVQVNRGYCELTGYTEEELLGRTFKDITHTDDRDNDFDIYQRLVRGEINDYRVAKRYFRNDGSTIIVEVVCYAIRDADGKTVRTMAVVQDVTERHREEEHLRRGFDQLKRFVENQPFAIAMLDKQLHYVAASKRWSEDYQLGNQTLIGRHHYDVFPEIRKKRDWQIVHQRALQGETISDDGDLLLREDGSEVWQRWEVKPWRDEYDRIGGIIISTEDITARKIAERSLRESERRFRLIYENIASGILITNPEGQFEQCNPAYSQILGYSEAELRKKNSALLIHPDDLAENLREVARMKSGEIDNFKIVNRYLRKDGTPVWVQKFVTRLADEEGKSARYLVLVTDITEIKRAEEILRNLAKTLEQRVIERTQELEFARNFAEMLLENQPAPVMVFDREGNIARINQACAKASNIRLDELTDIDSLLRLIPPGEQAGVDRIFTRLYSGTASLCHEHHWIDRDQRQRLFMWNYSVIKDVQGRVDYVICTGVDISELREAERKARENLEEAARLQRILTTNDLAMLLAHELNQPLAAMVFISDYCQRILEREALDRNALNDNLQQLASQAMRASEIVRRLRSFITKVHVDSSAIDLNSIVAHACQMFKRQADGHNIAISVDLDTSLPRVSAVAVHVEQVLFNLIRNALDAIGDSGASTGTVTLKTRVLEKRVRVTVSDSGLGVSADKADQIFEPLFSTKRYGLGVGLRISRNLIESLGGRLWVEPQQPGGIFHFEIPTMKIEPADLEVSNK